MKYINSKKKSNEIVIKKARFFLYKMFIMSILTVILLIVMKKNDNIKKYVYQNIYQKNFSFAYVNKIYKKYFGSQLPVADFLIEESKPVFSEELKYYSYQKYKKGVKLEVEQNYLVPILNDGIVVFIGEKKGYGKTVIIQQSNQEEVWYCNLDRINLKLYEYVNKGNYLGEVNNTLYLVFMKDGEATNYEGKF